MDAINHLIHKSITIIKENSTIEPPSRKLKCQDTHVKRQGKSMIEISEFKEVEQVEVDDFDEIIQGQDLQSPKEQQDHRHGDDTGTIPPIDSEKS